MKLYSEVILWAFWSILCFSQLGRAENSHVLYPFADDFIRLKLKCLKSLDTNDTIGYKNTNCKFNFSFNSNPPTADLQKQVDCEQLSNLTRSSNESHFLYEGFVTVPQAATSVYCDDSTVAQSLNVQVAELLEPFKRPDLEKPIIVLQRFSNDFSVRFGVHEVDGKNITIDGSLVDSFKLVCVHSSKVSWNNITKSKDLIRELLQRRDNMWLATNSDALKPLLGTYLEGKRILDKYTAKTFATRFFGNSVYNSVLHVQNITNATSRTYECSNENHTVTSYVHVDVKNPKSIGPDEILVIQEILTILENLASGKGQEKGPWYTLASLMSIILILFMYYCKKKLDQSKEESPKPKSNPENGDTMEETELTYRHRVISTGERPAQPVPETSQGQDA